MRILLLLPCFALCGCQAIQGVSEHAPEIEAVLDVATDAAPAIGAFNPALGMSIIVVAGILSGLTKMLKTKRSK